MRRLTALMALPLLCAGRSQSAPKSLKTAGSASKASHLYPLDFRNDGIVDGLKATPAIAFPIHCAEDGSAFLNLVDETAEHTGIYRVRDRHALRFDLEAVNDLHGVNQIDYFPDGEGVDFLVAARPGKTKSGEETGNPPTFIAKFGEHGEYRGAIELEVRDPLTRLAVLPSGEFLLAGYSEAQNVPELLLVDQHGQTMKRLDQPMSAKERNAGGWVPNATTFVSRKDTILVWRAQTSDALLEVGKGGASREIRLPLPAGTTLAGVAPSDDRIDAQLSTDASPPNQAANSGDMAWFEFDRLDGSLIRQLGVANEAIWVLACRVDGKYLAFKNDMKGGLLQFSAR